MKMNETQFRIIKEQMKRLVSQDGFYAKKFREFDVDAVRTPEDFASVPSTWKGDLREAYPLGLQAVPDEQIVRIHSSSGTTGVPGHHSLYKARRGGLGADVQALL